MFKFRVNRRRWARGGKKGAGLLLNQSKNMCCLGFLAKEAGYKNDQIEDLGCLDSVANRSGSNKLPTGLVKKDKDLDKLSFSDTRQCRRIMACNDKNEIKDDVREARLKKLFAAIGIDVEFYG